MAYSLLHWDDIRGRSPSWQPMYASCAGMAASGKPVGLSD
jgi:hypothetical protein